MLFYIFLFFFSTLFVSLGSKSKNIQKKILYGFGILLPALVATYRGVSVGYDTSNYIYLYETITSEYGIHSILTVLNLELFFIAVCNVGKYFGGYEFVFFSYSFLMLFLVVTTLDKYKRYLCVWLGYILFLFFFYNASLNIMRQMLALAYILYASTFLLRGRKKTYCIFIAFSISLHITAVIAGAMIYVIYKISLTPKKRKDFIYNLYYLSLIATFCLVNVVVTYLANLNFGNSFAYVSGMAKSYISSSDVMYSIMFIFISRFAMKRNLFDMFPPDFFYLSSLASLMLFLSGYYNEFLPRMAYYMTVFVCLYMPLIVKSHKSNKYKNIYKFTFLSLGLVYWIYTIVISGSNITIPYRTSGGLLLSF